MLTKLLRLSAVPHEYRSNFLHLYLDIAWFGLLSGSAINFLNIYATRIGATAFQIGLIGAMSAVVSLFLAIPTGRWLQTKNTNKANVPPVLISCNNSNAPMIGPYGK